MPFSKVCYYQKLLQFGLFALIICAFEAKAASNDGVKIRSIKPALEHGRLLLNFQIENLFSEKAAGTIQSGLPAVIEIEVKLVELGKKEILHKNLFCKIVYNIWDERYTLQSEDTVKFFTDFEKLKEEASRIQKYFLANRSVLKANARYRLNVRAGITPISSLQNRKLAGWLQAANETEDDITSQEHSSGFKLNISKLISFFIGNRQGRGDISRWQEMTFQLSDLQP